MQILYLIILLLQETPQAASSIDWAAYSPIFLVVGWALRELVPVLRSWRKETAETFSITTAAEATRSKAETDSETAAVSNVDKAAASIMKAAETVVKFSDDLSRCREERDELRAEKHFWVLEKTQLDASLRGASDKIARQDELIVELRKQLNEHERKPS